MNEKQLKGVESVEEGLQKRKELTDSESNYAYRGQENADWGVESGAARRLERKDAREDFVSYHFTSYHETELLEPARMDGHGVENGRELKDLELLANLQHHGAATCLIDFTRNFFVAMWFACKPPKEENGIIFILNTSDKKKFASLRENDLKKKVGDILAFQTRSNTIEKQTLPLSPSSEPSWWYWPPHGLNRRILKQDSLFVFGKPKMEVELLKKRIEISGGAKGEIREELKRLGITEKTLLKDLPGFADTHRFNSSLPREYGTPEYYFQKGNEAMQRGDHDGAIADYTRAIELKIDLPNLAKAYKNRGDAKSNLGDHHGAKADYDRAIELND